MQPNNDLDTSDSDTDSEGGHRLRRRLIYLEAAHILSRRSITLFMDNSKRIHFALEFIHSWDDTLFYRQFRLVRTDFYELLAKITEHIGIANLLDSDKLLLTIHLSYNGFKMMAINGV